MLTLWLATGVLARPDGQPPEPLAPVQRGDGFTVQPRKRVVHVEIEEQIEVIEQVAKAARKRPIKPHQIEAVREAVEVLTEARVAPIALFNIEAAADALQAATAGRMAFAKALERHAEAIRVEQKRRKRNEEAALVLLLAA
jgi:hypothetical protein